jgi:integrase/recombinase XerD
MVAPNLSKSSSPENNGASSRAAAIRDPKLSAIRMLPPRDAACLDSFIQDLQARACDHKTIDAYTADVRRFRQDAGKELIDVEAADVYRIVERWQAQNTAPSTVRRRASALRQFYDFLYSVGLISVRPMAELRVPKPWKRIAAPAVEDLELTLLAIRKGSPFDLRDHAVLLLLRDSGIRADAIARSEVRNVDWQLGRIMLRGDKYGKDHWVPLSKRSIAALRLYVNKARPYFLRGRDLPYLFVSPHGARPVTRQRIWQIANTWTVNLLGCRYSPHAWRRAVLTEGAERGMELFDLMQMAGHLDPTTTQRYVVHSTGKLREIFNRAHPRARKGKTE